jgi:HPt (histidine-containing phosphotransfer) domain-containing protein
VDIDALLRQVAQLLGGSEEPAPATAPASVFIEADAEEVPGAEGPIRSRFAGNPKLVPIVRKFAARLDEQLQAVQAGLAAGDLAEVDRLAHWLAGAAGTVGYDAFTEPARELEAAARAGDASASEVVLQRLLRMASQLELPEAPPGGEVGRMSA